LAVKLENAIEVEKLGFKSEGNSLLFNTLMFFQYQGYTDNTLYTYIACTYLINNISAKKVKNFLESTINHKVCEKTIKKCLHNLNRIDYLWKDKKFGYQLTNQKKITQKHTEEYNFDIPKFCTFLDSKFIIHDETFDIYLNSKFKNLKLFLFSDLICTIYHNEPISKSRLRDEFRLNQNEIKEFNKGFITKYKLSHGKSSSGHDVIHARIDEYYNQDQTPNEKKYITTANWYDDNDYLRNKKVSISVGNIFTKDHFSTTISLNEFTKQKLDKTFDENNYVEKDSKKKIGFEDKGRIVENDGAILLLSRENKTSFGIRRHQHIDALTGEYQTLNTSIHYPDLASKSYTVSCCQLTRFIGYGNCEEIDVKDSKQMLRLFSNLIIHNSLHNKEVLLTRKKDLRRFI